MILHTQLPILLDMKQILKSNKPDIYTTYSTKNPTFQDGAHCT